MERDASGERASNREFIKGLKRVETLERERAEAR